MTILTTLSVDIALSTFDTEGARRVRGWFDRLKNWDRDEAVRNDCYPLVEMPGVYALRAPDDFRVFFKVDGDTITILEIAKKSTILATTRLVEAE